MNLKYYKNIKIALDWLLLLLSTKKSFANSETIEVPNNDFHATANFLFEALDFDLDDINGLINHGCWCSKFNLNGAAPSVLLGGIAQDSLDSICQSWSRSRYCNDKLMNGECLNVDTTFSSYSIENDDADDENSSNSSNFECDDILNQDSCDSSSCSIDLYFINQIKNFLTENPSFTFQSNNENNNQNSNSCERVEPRSPYPADECQGDPFTSPGGLRVFSNTRFFVENCSPADDQNTISEFSSIEKGGSYNNNSTNSDYTQLKLTNPRFSNNKFWNENGFVFSPDRAIDGIFIGDPLSDIAHDSRDDTERHFLVDFADKDFNNNDVKNYKQFIDKVVIYPRRKIFDRYLDMIVYLNDCQNWQCEPVDRFTASYVRQNLNRGLEFNCQVVSANLQEKGVRLEKVNVHQLEDSTGRRPEGFRHRIQIAEIEVFGVE